MQAIDIILLRERRSMHMNPIPMILQKKAKELERKTAEKYPELAPLAARCFLNTMETTVTQLADGSYFVITGDIPAMWLRDSAAQLKPYLNTRRRTKLSGKFCAAFWQSRRSM